MKLINFLGSRKFALYLLVVLTLGLSVKPQFEATGILNEVLSLLLVAGYLLLTLSLMVCLWTNISKFLSRSLLLTMFHLSLTLLCMFGGLSMLTYGNWYFEIVEGGVSSGVSDQVRHGRLFDTEAARGISLESTRFTSEFSKGAELDDSFLYANLHDSGKFIKKAILSINRSLEHRQVRYHISSAQGYAGILTFQGKGEDLEPVQRTVVFPRFPSKDNLMIRRIPMSGSEGSIQIELLLNEKIYDATSAWQLKIPKDPQVKITFITDRGFSENTLSLGDQMAIGGTTLRFDEVRRWVGVNADHDPYKMPVFYSAFLALVFIGAHYLSRMNSAPSFMEDEKN